MGRHGGDGVAAEMAWWGRPTRARWRGQWHRGTSWARADVEGDGARAERRRRRGRRGVEVAVEMAGPGWPARARWWRRLVALKRREPSVGQRGDGACAERRHRVGSPTTSIGVVEMAADVLEGVE